MKITVQTHRDRLNALLQKYTPWHLWFAWKPIRLPSENGDKIIWLERVGRKGICYDHSVGHEWDYQFEWSYCSKEDMIIKLLQKENNPDGNAISVYYD